MNSKGIKSLILLSILSACTLHPKYQRENTPKLANWKVSFEETVDAKDSGKFWELFKDDALNTLVEKALKNNQDLQVAIENVNVFLAKLGVSQSKLYPEIQGNLGGVREKIPSTLTPFQGSPSVIGNAFDLVFNVSYLADFWGEVRSGAEASYHQYLASIQARKSVVLTIVSSTINSYFLLRQYDQQLIIAEETVGTRQRSYELALIRYQLGLTSKLQVEQALAELEFAKLEVERLHILIGEKEDLLSVLIGEPTTNIPRGLAMEDFQLPEEVLTEIPSSILEQRPDVKQAEEKLIAANAEIGVAKAKFFPQFNFSGSYGYESPILSNLLQNNSSIWGYGLNIIQEIFTGGRLTSNLKLTEAEKRKALYSYHSTILNAFKEVNDALIRLKYNKEIVCTQAKRVAALQKYLQISNLQYNEGQIDYLTFLDAERALFQAQLDQVESIAQSFISFVDIYKTMGGNWVKKADEEAVK
jgi:multidrug efflux system outer membrane protein